MYYGFQDKENVFLVMEYLSGGDLRFHLSQKVKFNENQSSIF